MATAISETIANATETIEHTSIASSTSRLVTTLASAPPTASATTEGASLDPGARIGIGMGSAIGALLVAACLLSCWRHRKTVGEFRALRTRLVVVTEKEDTGAETTGKGKRTAEMIREWGGKGSGSKGDDGLGVQR